MDPFVHGHSRPFREYKTIRSPRDSHHSLRPFLGFKMAPDDNKVPYGSLNIGGRKPVLAIKPFLFLT